MNQRLLFLCVLVVVQSAVGQVQRVVVIGGGLAGLSAAIEAYRIGATVTVLEKEKRAGGNSMKASSGMNAVATPPQARDHVSDTVGLFVADTTKSGQGRSDQALVRVLAEQSSDAWNFLAQFGVSLSILCQSGGHCRARTHRTDSEQGATASNVGRDIMMALITFIERLNDQNLVIRTQTRALSIVRNRAGSITGVEVQTDNGTQTIPADAVILATGGFCGDISANSMLAHYAPHLMNLSTTNGAFANGDGIKLAQALGAELIDMDQIQIHPTGFVDPVMPGQPRKFLAPESLRASGGILLNHQGKRFANELGTRDAVTHAILTYCEPYTRGVDNGNPITAYLILNQAGAQLFGQKILKFYERFGLVQHLANAHALADFLEIEPSAVCKTFEQYMQSARAGCDEFGKKIFPAVFETDEPLYVMLITPCLHYCMGGVRFDAQARVLGAQGPIQGLYGAGEVTGGLHGANRLCGNSLLECVVFGRIAGRNAAQGA